MKALLIISRSGSNSNVRKTGCFDFESLRDARTSFYREIGVLVCHGFSVDVAHDNYAALRSGSSCVTLDIVPVGA